MHSEGKSPSDEYDVEFKLYPLVQKRMGRSSRLDQKKISELESDIQDKERAVRSAILEFKALSHDSGKKGEMDLRRGILLARIGSLRNGINKNVMMLYHNMITKGVCREQKIGNGGYPDLYHSTPLAVILQKLGLPVLDPDIEEVCHSNIRTKLIEGKDLNRILDLFKGTGLTGSWMTVDSGSSRDNTKVVLVGKKDLNRTVELIRWMVDLMDNNDSTCHFSLSPGGPPDVRLDSMGVKGFITMMPQGGGDLAQIRTMNIKDLARMWVEAGYSIEMVAKGGYINQRKFSLQMLESSLTFNEHPVIRLRSDDSVREFLVDGLSLISRKIILMDTLKPRGEPKVETHYGKDFDSVMNRWSKTGYQMLAFSRKGF